MSRALTALLAVAAAFGVLATVLLPAGPATAVPAATRPAVTVVEEAHTAPAHAMGTRAQRDAYIKCVAPGTELTPALRTKLLRIAGKALEGIRAKVPAKTVVTGLARLYKITRPEASRAYWCTRRVWA